MSRVWPSGRRQSAGCLLHIANPSRPRGTQAEVTVRLLRVVLPPKRAEGLAGTQWCLATCSAKTCGPGAPYRITKQPKSACCTWAQHPPRAASGADGASAGREAGAQGGPAPSGASLFLWLPAATIVLSLVQVSKEAEQEAKQLAWCGVKSKALLKPTFKRHARQVSSIRNPVGSTT